MENEENTPEFEQDENENQNEESTEQSVETSQEDETDWKAEALKYKAILDRNKNKKPEIKSQPKEKSEGTMSIKDMYALNQANVHTDDLDEVLEYAKFKKISVAEALQSSLIKATLADKSEYRKTANVSNTGAARKGAVKTSDDTLQANLSKGIVPEKGSDEAERLFWARRGGKR